MMIPSGVRILEKHKRKPNLYLIILVDCYNEIEQRTYATMSQIEKLCEMMMDKTEIRLQKRWGRIIKIQKISSKTDDMVLLRIN